MLILVEKVETSQTESGLETVELTAEERQRSFFRCTTQQGREIKLDLKRGTVLNHGDILRTHGDAQGQCTQVLIIAKPEPVITVTASHPLNLLKAAYHLGNRHIALEVAENYLRLSPDPVLEKMLSSMPVTATAEIAPFHPERGAYHTHG